MSLCLRVCFWSGFCSWAVYAVDVRGGVFKVFGVSVCGFLFATIVRSPLTPRAVPRAATLSRQSGKWPRGLVPRSQSPATPLMDEQVHGDQNRR